MMPDNRFAPVSGAPSLLILVAAWNFILNGAANAFLAILMLASARRMPVGPAVLATAVALRLAAAGGLFWTGRLLQRRERRGGWFALGFTLLPLLPALFGARMDWVTIVWTLVSLLVLASVWDDLTEPDAPEGPG